jgi:hypothetical protein
MKFPEYSLSVPWSDTCKCTEECRKRETCVAKTKDKFFENRLCKHGWKHPLNSNGQWIRREGLSSNGVRELCSATCCICAWNILPNYLRNNISFCLSMKPVAYVNITLRNILHDISHTWIIKLPLHATKF